MSIDQTHGAELFRRRPEYEKVKRLNSYFPQLKYEKCINECLQLLDITEYVE